MIFDATKVSAVRQYLLGEFPDQDVDDTYNFECMAQDFRIGHGSVSRLVRVSGEFLMDHDAGTIRSILQRSQLADTMRSAGNSRVLVTTQGLNVELP